MGRFLPVTVHSNRYWPILPPTLSLQFALLSHSTSVVTCVFYRQVHEVPDQPLLTLLLLYILICLNSLYIIIFPGIESRTCLALTCNPRSDIAFLVKINSPIQNLHNLLLVFFVLWCIQTTYYLTEDVTVQYPTLNVTKCFMDVILCTRWHTQQHSVSFQVILNFDSTIVTVSHLSYSIVIIWS